MTNPYENYIKLIDVILRKIEADPQAKVYRMDTADFPRSHSIEQNQEQVDFLHKLAKKQVVGKIESNKINIPLKPFGQVRIALSYNIHEPNKKLLLKERKRLMEFDKGSSKEGNEQSEKIILFLTPDSDLYREPKSKYCYPMSKERMREKIVRFLIGKGYQSTAIIQNEVGSVDAQSVRLAISKINSNAKTLLGLRNKIIEGKRDSGYRINPQYKFTK